MKMKSSDCIPAENQKSSSRCMKVKITFSFTPGAEAQETAAVRQTKGLALLLYKEFDTIFITSDFKSRIFQDMDAQKMKKQLFILSTSLHGKPPTKRA